ncbi:MAG: hypothetical protein OXL96_26220 [Candidatus Poribacteria bacterium]|nr:hypothetical protein [Candidatus Poribacteria bacterium]
MRKLSTVSIFKGRNLAASVGKIAKLAIINLLSEALSALTKENGFGSKP